MSMKHRMPDLSQTALLLTILLLVFSAEIQTKDVPAAVAFKCGKPSLYLTPVGWMLDEEQPCLHRNEDILAYCRRVYNDSSFDRVAFTTVIDVTLPNWCHANLSDCPPSVENRTTYLIQPWICSGAPPPQLTVPVNCSLKRIDDPHHESYSCHKAAYWLQAAQTACKSGHTVLANSMPIKPCIKVDSYSTMHYLGADIVCCSNLTDNNNSKVSSVGLSGTLLGSADTTLIISKDERIYNNYLAANTNQTAENKTYENQQFKLAKAAEKVAYALRKTILEDELRSAEERLSATDWLHNPEQTQEIENALQKEFFQKYMALDEENREMQHRLDTVHWKRGMQAMEHRKKVVLDQWNNLMEQPNVNLTVLEHAADRLLYTLENQRARVIRRFDRVRFTNPSEARRILPEVRQHLSDLDHLLNNSLAKLDKVPAYKNTVIEHVLRLRKAHYAQTDASAREIAVMSSVNLSEGAQLPTPSDEAALRAAKLISQYEHHLMGKSSPSDGIRKPVDAQQSSTTTIHRSEHIATVVPSLAMPRPSEARTVENKGQSHAVVVSYPKSRDPQPADSTEDIVVEIHLPTPQPSSRQTTVTNAASQVPPEGASLKHNKAQIVVPAILACLVFLLVVVLIARCYVRRMRLQRAGYNLTVVEVDEVANTEATNRGPHLPRLGRGRLTTGSVGTGATMVGATSMVNDHDPVDPLARWQVNGYENPAYKFTEGGYTFSPAD